MRFYALINVQRPAFTMKQLLIVIAITATLVGMVIPQVQKWRDAECRVQSTQNIKTLALAFHYFHAAHKRLPYNGTARPYQVDDVALGGLAVAGDERTGSWAFQILPFINQRAVFAVRDANASVPAFMCPGRTRPMTCQGFGGPGAWTDYFLNSFINDPNGAWDVPDNKRAFVDFKDGTSWTILLTQGQIKPEDYRNSAVIPGFTEIIFKGGSPALCRPNKTIGFGRDSADSLPGNWGGPFKQICLIAMADASIRNFPYTQTAGVIRDGIGTPVCSIAAYLTPDGGEPVTMGD